MLFEMVSGNYTTGRRFLSHRRHQALHVAPLATALLQRLIPVVAVFHDCEGTDMISVDFNNIGMGTHAKDGLHHLPCDPLRVYHAFAEGGFEKLIAETGPLFEETPLGSGGIDWPSYLDALKMSGFDGYLTIERETGADPSADIRAAIAFLRQQIKP